MQGNSPGFRNHQAGNIRVQAREWAAMNIPEWLESLQDQHGGEGPGRGSATRLRPDGLPCPHPDQSGKRVGPSGVLETLIPETSTVTQRCRRKSTPCPRRF